MVTRLGFTIPEFIRTIWTSEEARSAWQSRVSAVCNKFPELEIAAVRAGLKPTTLQSCAPERLVELTRLCASYELVVVPLAQQGSRQTYSNAAMPFDPHKPWDYRVVIGRPYDVAHFIQAWNDKNDREMGELLGFPTCCQSFFEHYWNQEGYRDLTYPMVYDPTKPEQRVFKVECNTSNNILLRWLGIRRVSHLPCSFTCEATRTIGDKMHQLAERFMPREAVWMTAMLNWPVRWSSLHGVAIITTPVVRIVTSTDAFGDEIRVDKLGVTYPQEGATGIEFPFQTTFPLQLRRKDKTYWTDNGFRSEAEMNRAHEGILKAARHAEVPAVTKILEVGAGNGVLLEKLGSMFPAELVGIEYDRERWERAERRGAERGYTVLLGDYRKDHWNPPYGMVVIALNRLLEITVDDAHQFLKQFAQGATYLLVYSYDQKEFDVSWSDWFKMVYSHNWDSNANGPVVYLLRSLYDPELRPV